jgi:mannose-6-phosphate isomerase-like protein (cupin superfamily)
MDKGKLFIATCAVAASLIGVPLMAQTAPAGRPPLQIAWSPKKTPYRAYETPNRAWWKLADVLALHKGKSNWSQPIIRNKDLMADWHQMAPGGHTPELEYPDNRTGIIVWAGQLKVSIKGQEPFVASKGFEIDVPFRLPFTLESVGTEPALWFEVHAAGDVPIYPIASTPEKPKDVPGFSYQKAVLMGGDGKYDEVNKPYLDFFKDVVATGVRAGPFISGDHMFMNNIRGRGTPTPPPANIGHFHFGHDEFWFVMEGNIDYQIEGVPFFTAAPGDIVTAAQGRWHRASFGAREVHL